jgi:hypothetical protein
VNTTTGSNARRAPGTADAGIGVGNPVADERQVKARIEMAVEVIGRDEVVQ